MAQIGTAISVLFLILGTLITVVNWIGVYKATVKKEQTGSWIPFIGGIMLLIGLLLLPNSTAKKMCWIGCIVDWGSIPGIVYTVVALLRRKRG